MSGYEVIISWCDEDQSFIAEAPELPGCMADGSNLPGGAAQCGTGDCRVDRDGHRISAAQFHSPRAACFPRNSASCPWLILWGTGFGPTDPAVATRIQSPFDRTYSTSNPEIPSSTQDGDIPIQASIGGFRSQAPFQRTSKQTWSRGNRDLKTGQF